MIHYYSNLRQATFFILNKNKYAENLELLDNKCLDYVKIE